MPSDVDVVVLEEQHLAGEARVAHQLRDLLQHPLAGMIVRMRLAGEDELHRHPRVVDERRHGVDVLQHQRRALVGREPAREADGERVEAERALQLRDELRRLAARARRAAPPAAAPISTSCAFSV